MLSILIAVIFVLKAHIKCQEMIPIFRNENYEELIDTIMPVSFGVEAKTECFCKTNFEENLLLCNGCREFPNQVHGKSLALIVKTSDITKLGKGCTDAYGHLEDLHIEFNPYLTSIEHGAFRKLCLVRHLSISYNEHLLELQPGSLEGLFMLESLSLLNNGFNTIFDATKAILPLHSPNLKKLDLSQGYFRGIFENDFSAMKNSSVLVLDLSMDQLEFAHPKSLRPLKNLKYLRIGENNLHHTVLKDLISDLKSVNINLVTLELARMGYRKTAPPLLINEISNSSISRLSLAQNQFHYIVNDTFPRMPQIEHLDLSENLIVWIEPDGFAIHKFPNLKHLNLNGNNIAAIRAVQSLTQIQTLNLSWNSKNLQKVSYFELGDDNLANIHTLISLDLSKNRILTLTERSFYGLSNLKYLSLSNGSIFFLNPGVFINTPNLEVLDLEKNFLQSNNNLTKYLFEGLNYLKVLNLRDCHLKYIAYDDLFSYTQNLTDLNLAENLLVNISSTLFEPLKRLSYLNLENNNLVSWSSSLLATNGIPLQTLKLADNKLTKFSKAMLFDMQFMLFNHKADTVIDLKNNHFECDCKSLFSFKTLLTRNSSKALYNYILRESPKIMCSSPGKQIGTPVLKYIEDMKKEHFCSDTVLLNSLSHYLWLIPLILCFAIMTSTFIVLAKYRYYFNYLLFMARWKIVKRKPYDSNRTYKYDAFVSYSSEDADFVLRMINKLEKEEPFFRLCVYERDFEIGCFISDCVTTAMNESKYVFLIVSNNFAKSHWCRWETHLAECSRILDDRQAYNTLILIKLSDVEQKWMTPLFQYLLKSKVYLSWDGKDKEDMFWKKIRNVLQR